MSFHRGSMTRYSVAALVTVPFGQSKSCMGLVISTHDTPPTEFIPKEITGIIPLQTAINERLTDFLLWVSDYYMAFAG